MEIKKLIGVIAVLLFQAGNINAQFADTLTVVEIENGKPKTYAIAFVKEGKDYFYKTATQKQRFLYSEIKNGMTRYILKDEEGSYIIHLIKEIGNGYYQYIPMVAFDSLSNAKSYTPDLKLFSYGFTGAGIGQYLKKPKLDTVTKEEALDFLAFQYKTYSALKEFCGYLVKHSGMRDNYQTGKELYTRLKERFQVQAYLNWLTIKGYNGASYMELIFQMVLAMSDKELMDKATEYSEKEATLYK